VNTNRRIFQVRCPSCSTEFPIDSGKLPENGVAAICSVCLRVFPVHHPVEEVGGEAESPETPDSSDVDLDRELEAAVEISDELSNTTGTELVYEVEVVETEVIIEEFILDDDAIQILDEGDPVSTGDEFVATDSVASEYEAVEEFSEADAVAIDEPEVAVAPDGEAEGATEAQPEVEAAPVAEVIEPTHERPIFEDLSSFTNQVLSESTSETAAPVVEKSRPAPEKVERFGRRDPHERARHLARVLVSDIIAYYPVRYQESLARRTLQEDFADEIQKSYREYVDQVGNEMAESTPYFVEALNHVLGRGEKFF